jgi:hypothetical protein
MQEAARAGAPFVECFPSKDEPEPVELTEQCA